MCFGAPVAGNCLVVWRLDRLGRSLADLIRIVTQLEECGIALESIMERMDTASPAGRPGARSTNRAAAQSGP